MSSINDPHIPNLSATTRREGGDRTPAPSSGTNAVIPVAAAGAREPTEREQTIYSICLVAIDQTALIMGHLTNGGSVPHSFHARCLQLSLARDPRCPVSGK